MSDNDLALQEMMEIEIKFGKGKTDHVIVHYGDDPLSLAQDFVDRHRLKPSSVNVIAEYIRNTIEDFQAQMKEMAMQSPSLEEGNVAAASTFPASNSSNNMEAREPIEYKESQEQSNPNYQRSWHHSDNDSVTTLPPAPSSHPTSSNHPSGNSVTSSQDHHASEYDDDGRASLSTTTTVPTNPIPHLHSSPGPPVLNTSPKQVTSSHKPYQDAANRSRSGSFSLTTSHKGEVEYDITRFQTDSLNVSREGLGGDAGDEDRMHEGENAVGDGFKDDIEYGDDDLFDASKTLSPFKKEKESEYDRYDDYGEEYHEPEETEEEKYNRLLNQAKKAGGKSVHIQPTSNTLVIKKHFHLTDSKGPGLLSKNKNTKVTTIPKTAHERLYVHAELKRNKNEKLKAIQDQQKEQEIAQNQYKLNPVSAQLASHNDHIYAHYDHNITEKLYHEGKKHLEQKQDKSNQVTSMKTKYVYEWSCAKCGNHHKVSRNVLNEHTPPHMIPRLYICSICQFDQSESILSHKPTNIGLLYNPDVQTNVQNRRQQAIEQVELKDDLNTYNTQLKNDSKIHEYLYTEGRMQDKILKFNAMLYQEMQTKLTFAPSLPSNTVELLEKMRDAGDHDASVQRSLDGGSISSSTQHTANPKTERAEYLRTNILTRLTEPTHYTTSYKEMQKARKPKPKVVPEPLKGEKEKFFNRLVYEYKEKNMKLQLDQDVYHSVDPNTKQPLYQPHVPAYPMQHTQTFTKMPIWQKLQYKDQKIRQKIADQHKTQVDKLLKELHDKSARASDVSNTILESSMEKNLEELFKLLLVTNEIYHDHKAKEQAENTDESEQVVPIDPSKAQSKDSKPKQLHHVNSFHSIASNTSSSFVSLPVDIDVDSVYSQAQNLENWESKSLDLLAILPNILINEVSTLLMDMQRVWHRREEKKKVEKILFGSQKDQVVGVADDKAVGIGVDNGDVDLDGPLLINYAAFKHLAKYCMKRRVGPGTSYLFAPRRPPTAPTQPTQPLEDEECTFTPSIDKHSVELLKTAGNMRVCVRGGGNVSADSSVDGSQKGSKKPPHIPIESILQAEGERIKNKQQALRMEATLKQSKECTYQPHLYPVPAYVQPRYTIHLGPDEGEEESSGTGGKGEKGKAMGKWTTPQEVRRERYVQYTAHANTSHSQSNSPVPSPPNQRNASLSPGMGVSGKASEGTRMRGAMMGEELEVDADAGKDLDPTQAQSPTKVRSRSSSPSSLGSNSGTISTKFTVDDLPTPPRAHAHTQPSTLHTPVPSTQAQHPEGLRRLESGGGFSWHQHIHVQSTPGTHSHNMHTPHSSATPSRVSDRGGKAVFDLSYSRSEDVLPPPAPPSLPIDNLPPPPPALPIQQLHPAIAKAQKPEKTRAKEGYSAKPQPALTSKARGTSSSSSSGRANASAGRPLPLLPEETSGRRTGYGASNKSLSSADVSRRSSQRSQTIHSYSSKAALGQGLDDSSVLSYSDSSSTVKRKK